MNVSGYSHLLALALAALASFASADTIDLRDRFNDGDRFSSTASGDEVLATSGSSMVANTAVFDSVTIDQ